MLFVCLIHVGAWRCVRCIGLDVFIVGTVAGHMQAISSNKKQKYLWVVWEGILCRQQVFDPETNRRRFDRFV